MHNIDKDQPYNLPTYPPTWMDQDTMGDSMWVVYDQRDGFSADWALVFADNADDAALVAEALARPDTPTDASVLADGRIYSRLDSTSKSLRVVKVRDIGTPWEADQPSTDVEALSLSEQEAGR